MAKIKNDLLYPSAEEGRIIRECAKKSAGRRGVKLEVGERYNMERDDKPTSINLCLVSDDPNWNDTDLNDTLDWYTFRYRGVQVAEGGRVLCDFYVYETNEDGELCTNVQAYYEDGEMQWVRGTGDGLMWRRQ